MDAGARSAALQRRRVLAADHFGGGGPPVLLGIRPIPTDTLYVVTSATIRAPVIKAVRPLASLRWSNWMTYSRFTVTGSPFHVMFSPWWRLTPVPARGSPPVSLLPPRPRPERPSGPIVRAGRSAPVSVIVAGRQAPGGGAGVASGV